MKVWIHKILILKIINKLKMMRKIKKKKKISLRNLKNKISLQWKIKKKITCLWTILQWNSQMIMKINKIRRKKINNSRIMNNKNNFKYNKIIKKNLKKI